MAGSHGFWAWQLGSNSSALGSPRDQHVHILNLTASPAGSGGESRIAFVFGLTTPPATLQTLGEAVWRGYFRADAYRTGDQAHNLRQRYSGNLRIVANFDISRLYGDVIDVRGSQPGSSTRNPLPTSSFRISEGQIHGNGQFTATLAGMDSDASVPDKDSVRGVMGRILGEFYGPNAEELGGALTASRDLAGEENDLVFYGYVRGVKERDIASDDSPQFSAIVHRDWGNDESSLSGATATVEPSGDGYRITFTIDGVAQSVDVTEADRGAFDSSPGTYQKSVNTATESKRVWLWRPIGSFPGQPEFDYLDVHGVSLALFTPGEEQTSVTDVQQAFLVRGTRTATSDMPSGTASYGGRLEAKEWMTATPGDYESAPEYRGDFTMTADFGAGSISATASNMGHRPGSSGSFDYAGYATTGLTFEGTVSGNAIVADTISGTGAFAGYGGSAQGAFYGPQAAEVGGVLSGENATGGTILQGWFAGRKQQ